MTQSDETKTVAELEAENAAMRRGRAIIVCVLIGGGLLVMMINFLSKGR